MSELRFDGRVVIVTGAGAGLGRQHALTFAARGAKVVVNDLGGSTSGDGKSSAAADLVVNEIRALGGEAVANYDSVEHGDRIVKTAVDTFGTVDIVINNAGILRDISFHKMSDLDWDLVTRVHLNGSKSVTQAAWPIMRDKGYGRVIMTTSGAGIYGNFGQANYCAAKLGILGLANCLAVEGESKNIHVNVIAPIAASRLTESTFPPDIFAALTPEAVSPLVAWLCHEECDETKGLFEVGAGYISKLRWERTLGHSFPLSKKFSVDDVKSRWSKITDFTEAEHPGSVAEAVTAIFKNITNPSLGGNEFIDLDVAAQATLVLENSYDERDVSLYALGIGCARDPFDKDELKYVYEMGGDFRTFPTYGVMPQSNAMLAGAKEGGLALPGCTFGFDRLLHGEQYTEIKRPLPPHAKLKHTFKLKTALDKAPNAVLTFAISSTDESGEEVIYNEMTAFVKGAGGWGGDRGSSTELNVPPARVPDAVIEEKTDVNQTLLYRLSGDWNPLHADPDFAQAFGFDKPILHGLCTFGYCGRHVVKAFANNDSRYFKSIKVRFAKSVFPGDTLVTKMWKESPTRIIFETSVKERDEVVIKNAVIELYSEIPVPKASRQQAETAAQAHTAAAPVGMIPTIAFSAIGAYIADNPSVVEKGGAVVQVNLSDPDSQWVLDLKNGKGCTYAGVAEKPDVTMTAKTADYMEVCEGKADAQKLFFAGKLKLAGNMMAAQKLDFLRSIDRKYFDEALAREPGAASTASPAPTAAPVVAQSGAIFAALAQRLAKDNKASVGLSGVVQFNISEPDVQWLVDFDQSPALVQSGKAQAANVTLGISDENLVALVKGERLVRDLYQHGELRVEGDVLLAHGLQFLNNLI